MQEREGRFYVQVLYTDTAIVVVSVAYILVYK